MRELIAARSYISADSGYVILWIAEVDMGNLELTGTSQLTYQVLAHICLISILNALVRTGTREGAPMSGYKTP